MGYVKILRVLMSLLGITVTLTIGSLVLGTFAWWEAKDAWEYEGLSLFQFWGLAAGLLAALILLVLFVFILKSIAPVSWKSRASLLCGKIAYAMGPFLALASKVSDGVRWFLINIVLLRALPLSVGFVFLYASVMAFKGSDIGSGLLGLAVAGVALVVFFNGKAVKRVFRFFDNKADELSGILHRKIFGK